MKQLYSGLLIAVASISIALSSQAPPFNAKEHMKKLEYLVGQWEGEGWNSMTGKPEPFTITETIQSKLDGTVLILEGLGRAKSSGGNEGPVVHQAMGVLSYDGYAKVYRLRSFLVDGRFVDAEAEFLGDDFRWKFDIPRYGSVRYTISRTEKGEWFEIGEMSRDGETWNKFHEMTLRKVK